MLEQKKYHYNYYNLKTCHEFYLNLNFYLLNTKHLIDEDSHHILIFQLNYYDQPFFLGIKSVLCFMRLNVSQLGQSLFVLGILSHSFFHALRRSSSFFGLNSSLITGTSISDCQKKSSLLLRKINMPNILHKGRFVAFGGT